jgi:hypothetical protein
VATAAADKSPLCLIGIRNITSGASTVRLYSGFSATPTSSVPVNTPNGPWNIAISDHGARAVVGYVSAGGAPSVDVYSTAGGLTLINSYAVPGANVKDRGIKATCGSHEQGRPARPSALLRASTGSGCAVST